MSRESKHASAMPSRAKLSQPGFAPGGLKRIDEMMQGYVAQGKSAGMLCLLSRNGVIAHLSTHGYADIADTSPMREDSIFRIYSMTKPITSVALLTLMERGHFRLDDAAKHWIPALSGLRVDNAGNTDRLVSDISIRQLLTHTAGFSYGFEPEKYAIDKRYAEIWRSQYQSKTIAQLMDSIFDIPLIAQPGTCWRYSVATDICGYLVELISDMPIADYLRQTIFEPLGMVDTAFAVTQDKFDRLASLYGYTTENPLAKLENNEASAFAPTISGIEVNFHSGGGGLVSSATDYWRFAQMMLNRGELNGSRIISADTVALMTRNHLPHNLLPLHYNGIVPAAQSGYGFGLGYCINIDPANTGAAGSLGDFGWGGMADTYCWVDPGKQLVAILMQQFMPSLHHAGRCDFRNAVYQALI